MTNFPKIVLLLLIVLLIPQIDFAQEYRIQEPVPSAEIKVSASSEFHSSKTIEAVSGNGLVNHLHVSDNLGKMMWMSEPSEQTIQACAETKKGVVWLRTEFEKVRKIESLSIWNYNQDNHTNRGLQKVYLQYSVDGTKWQTLMNGERDFFILPKAQGRKLEPASFELNLKGLEFRYFCVTADMEEGNYYHDHLQSTLDDAKEKNQNINYYGLSEIRFFELKKQKAEQLTKISSVAFKAFPAYRKTAEGPAREFNLAFGQPLFTGGTLEISCSGKSKSIQIPASEKGIYELAGTLPAGYMDEETRINLQFTSQQGNISQSNSVEPARKWVLYFLPHSHLDIGYTHCQPDVLALQIRNLKRAMDLIEQTKAYPEGSGFKWNVEVLWPVTEWMKKEKDSDYFRRFKEYVRTGKICLNGSAGSILTGISKQEELMHLCDDSRILEKETGTKIQSVMMSDVPGLAWGSVTGLAQSGIRYLSMAPNYVPFLPTGGSRVGYVHREWGDYPFYWQSQSGDEKVLYWSSGKGYSLFHDWLAGKLSSSGTAYIWRYLEELEGKKFPYDISYLRYTVNGDNGPPDEQMSEVIRGWNEIYEYPKFKIGTSDEVFSELEHKYGESLPSYKGDFTPYWEEGAASTAAELAMNRKNSDRLSQLEILWTMTNTSGFPAAKFNEAWRNVVLFSEHTWGASASYSDYQSDNTKRLWNEKRGFAIKADSITRSLENPVLGKNEPSGKFIQVYNTCAWPRTDLVKIKAGNELESKVLVDENGEKTEVQRIAPDEWIFIASKVPALSSKVYHPEKRKENDQKSSATLKVDNNKLSNGWISAEIDGKQGTIRSLTGIGNEYNFASGNGLNEYLYSETNLKNQKGIESLDSLKVVQNGPVAISVRAYGQAPGCNSLVRQYTLYRGLYRLDIENCIDKKEIYSGENVRFCFPFSIENAETGIDLAFAKMIPERDQLAGSNKNFFCMNNGVSVEGQKYGILLANTDAPILEIGTATGEEWMKDRKEYFGWNMTTQSSPVIYSWVMNNSWHTNYKATQSGKVSFIYSLVPLQPYDDSAKKIAFELANPLVACFSDNPKPVFPMISIGGSSWIAVSTMHPAIDGSGVFVRLVNLSEKPVKCGISSASKPIEKASLCDNNENLIREINPETIWMKPYATINLKIKQ